MPTLHVRLSAHGPFPLATPTERLSRAGLDGFDTVDAAFFFTVTDLTADLSNLLSFSSANVLIRLLTSQLNDVRPHCRHVPMPRLRLLWLAALPSTAHHDTPQRRRCSDCPLYVQAGLDVGLQLIWVDYTSTQGAFPPGGEPPNFQAVRTTLQVRAAVSSWLGTTMAPQDVRQQVVWQ